VINLKRGEIMSKNLFENQPIAVIYPLMVKEIGLYESFILSKLHYLNVVAGDGDTEFMKYGTYLIPRTTEDFMHDFPFMTKSWVCRAVNSLLKKQIIYTEEGKAGDYYGINYEKLEEIRKRVELMRNPYSAENVIVCKDTGERCSGDKYLSTNHWRLLKQSVYCSHNGICQSCGRLVVYKDANVHHLNYNRMGDESGYDVELLCADCHAKLHNKRSKGAKTYEIVQEKPAIITEKDSDMCVSI
jgi:5-methylcytosine-specific restriction endonuclease McrA